jgi:hypothetical protein
VSAPVADPLLILTDTEALAVHHGVAPGTIRRWASEDRWTPYGTRRHRLWSMDDAQASARKRAGVAPDQ